VVYQQQTNSIVSVHREDYLLWYISRDDAALKGWREDAKKLQARKQYQMFTKGTKGLYVFCLCFSVTQMF
jgi:hypothetical protein